MLRKQRSLVNSTLVLFAGMMLLAACESPEDRQARETQFDGQSLDAVVTKIGQPTQLNANKAIWFYRDTQTNYVPVYSYNQYGQATVVSHNRQVITVECKYAADLKSGRVVRSTYQGNSCERFAPKLPK